MFLNQHKTGNSLIYLVLWLVSICSSGCKKSSEDASVEKAIKPAENEIAIDSILDHVLVLENTNSPTSIEISKYYREKRGVKKFFQIRCPDSAIDVINETLDFGAFQETIGKPVW
jgi:hypothetical protein